MIYGMSTASNLPSLYRPTHDEAARQRFVGVLKGHANQTLEQQLAARYERVIRPAYEQAMGRAPATREEARPLFEVDPLYQLWGSTLFASQGLMWETVGETCRRVGPAFESRATTLSASVRGSLSLNPDLAIPEPIASENIHRQPGGYFHSDGAGDLHAGLLYFGTLELYRSAKGLTTKSAVGEPGIGRFIANVVRKYFPDLAPKRILDLGCATGTETVAYAETFADAEVHGLDLSAGFLRFAHAWAEERGVAVHYRQADARRTGYPDGHFDLIVSHILFHETWHDVAPGILSEAYRLLAPGGVLLNADVPYQPARLSIPKQVTNDWQVRNNGEPFWTGFADTDVPALLRAAGFAPQDIVSSYEALGQGEYLFFGGRRA